MGKFDGVLLALDMDGTLLDDEKKVSKNNIRALEYFTENGGYFALATGRTRPGTDEYRRILPCNCSSVYLNGAIICDERDGSPVFMEGLDDNAKIIAKRIMSEFPEAGIEIFLLDRSYICSMNDTSRDHFENILRIPYQVINIEDVPEETSLWGKINFTGEPELVDKIQKALRDEEKRYNLTYSLPVYYEMTCKGGHKGDGVLRAAEYMGVKREHIYTAGDSMNDIPMLKIAKTSFVPQNGKDEAKAIAGKVVRDNNHDAIADIVDYLDAKY